MKLKKLSTDFNWLISFLIKMFEVKIENDKETPNKSHNSEIET